MCRGRVVARALGAMAISAGYMGSGGVAADFRELKRRVSRDLGFIVSAAR